MIKRYFLLIALLIASVSFVKADDAAKTPQQEEEKSERLKYFKAKYEEVIDAPFEKVWKAMMDNITEKNCRIAYQKITPKDNNLKKGVLRSDYLVYSEGKDSTYSVMQRYHYDMIYIPGGVWITARVRYKLMLDEFEANKVKVTLEAELSGFEEHVKNEFFFWKSNGLLEHLFFENAKKKIN
jgi:hypothetical protein